ncbi:phosphoribosylglycinamide formyltransferase [Desulfonema magnum]|uniref:Phosphoribosylglycinamide formyltransferase n=1 Tax=Desulfonema magnum TaxID=45655 RepID=A0A975GMQ1_9BACT|nr:phosphoribosylglycinamide formyltransferase [Desulfonema magnum]QTA87176.1 Phosphoribosylglycinamide formyltransferase [Desulfonema magnum]
MSKKIRIGTLISGSGTNLQAIIDSCESGNTDGEVVFIGSDNPNASGLERGHRHGIPTFTADYKSIIEGIKKAPEKIIPPDDFDMNDLISKQSLFSEDFDAEKMKVFMITRAIAEAKLLEYMKAYPFDLLVLAGFMRTLTPYFIDRINTVPGNLRIMNIHPSLLPAFPGVDGYGDTFRYGCKIGGCTVHFVDYGEDSGPIIGQKTFQIQEHDTLETIKKKGLSLEWELYSECIQMFAEDRLKVVEMTHILENGKKMRRTVVKIDPRIAG